MRQKPISEMSQGQRVLIAALYLGVLSLLFVSLGGNFNHLLWQSNLDPSILFYSGALLIVLGAYLVEPFFTTPTDAITNALAIIIALLNLDFKDRFFGYGYDYLLDLPC